MEKIDKLINSLNVFIAKADEEESLEDVVSDFPGIENLSKVAEDYEKAIAKLFRIQRKWFLDEFEGFVSKSDKETLEAFLVYLTENLFAADEFAEEFGEETAEFLQLTIEGLAKAMMDSIDKDIQFETLSNRTTNWIRSWSEDLAELMQLNSHEALERELLQAIEQGESIAEVELRMKDMPQFDRKRARATARTEVLRSSSVSHFESFQQSPAVVGKKWKHSGGKKITPREDHVALDGVEIGLDEYFDVGGEQALYPRDVSLSPKQAVNCGCVLGPVVDEEILGLSKEEKEAIRQEVLAELNS